MSACISHMLIIQNVTTCCPAPWWKAASSQPHLRSRAAPRVFKFWRGAIKRLCPRILQKENYPESRVFRVGATWSFESVRCVTQPTQNIRPRIARSSDTLVFQSIPRRATCHCRWKSCQRPATFLQNSNFNISFQKTFLLPAALIGVARLAPGYECTMFQIKLLWKWLSIEPVLATA